MNTTPFWGEIALIICETYVKIAYFIIVVDSFFVCQ